MHTIDLLRGKGVPVRTTIGRVALVMVAVAIPLLFGAGMLDRYLRNKTVISIQRQAIAKEQAAIDELSDVVKSKESLEEKRDLAMTTLSEVSSCIGRYVQWSPILVTLAEKMPAEVILTTLSANRKQVTIKVSEQKDPSKTISVSVPKRTLVLNISGNPLGNYDKAIKDFRDHLELSPLLGPKLEDIVVSQQIGRLGNDEVVSYVMNCVFEAAF
jgi:hypothetical protein